MRILTTFAAILLLSISSNAQECAAGFVSFPAAAPGGCKHPSTGEINFISYGGGTALPTGSIIIILSGSCPSGYTEATELNGVMLLGTLAANADVGTTGGADTITPTGSNSAPGFTGTAATLAHAGTAVSAHAGTAVAAHVFTQPATAWPVGVPANSGGAVNAHSGAAVVDHASHTHTYTDVVNHVHVQSVNSAATGGLSGYTADTSTNTSVSSGYSTANPTGSVATGTTAGPSAVLTHSVTQPANHTFTQPTIAWPVGVPTNSGGAVDAHAVTQPSAHTVTQPSDHSYTPAGSVAAPILTMNSFNNRPTFVRVIFCKKT